MLPYVTIHLHILHLVAVHCVFISPIPYISLGRKIHLASNFFQLMGEGEIFFCHFYKISPPPFMPHFGTCVLNTFLCVRSFQQINLKLLNLALKFFIVFPGLRIFILKPISKSKYLGYRVIEGG